VAAPPLFDITRMDLTKVAASREDVEQVNPHRGPMRMLDRVIWFNEEATVGLGVKEVRDDEFWVAGHVPGRPLLPGVLMIEATAQLCSFLQGMRPQADKSRFIGFIRCDDIVFRGQVVPGDTLYLLAEEIACRRQRFTSAIRHTPYDMSCKGVLSVSAGHRGPTGRCRASAARGARGEDGGRR
jgi:3-hydroxyacyl-[acyl-carrier-protein] dehydratase